jgi:hypothetical protein
MRELGSVLPENATELPHARAQDVEQAVATLESRLDRGAADEVILYVSSHADEGQLHLGGTHLPMTVLTDFLARTRAGVALLILDSCHSGAITRAKGLKPIPGIRVDVETPHVEGRVIISASGPDEAAQESDTLHGSYFTHHLIAALRGAADQSHDGRVTLEEAFRYAYVHTLESTYATRGGLQHPAFHVDLRGHGDWVLTNPGGAPSRLVLAFSEPGTWVVTPSGDGLAGEFEKPPGAGVLALEPGVYRLRTKRGNSVLEASLRVPESGSVILQETDLHASALSESSAKGGAGYWNLSAGAEVSNGLVESGGLLSGVSTRLEAGHPFSGAPALFLSGGVGYRRSATTPSPGFTEEHLDLHLGAALGGDSENLRGRAGLDLGATVIRESQLPGMMPLNGTAPGARLVFSGSLRIAGHVFAVAELHGGPSFVKTIAGFQMNWSAGLELGLGVDFL